MPNLETQKNQINWIQDKIKSYNPSELEREYLNYILKRKFELDDSQRNKLDEWADSQNLYDNIYKEDSSDNNPIINIAKEIEVIETKVADEIKSLPEIKLIAKNEKDIPKVQALTKVLEYIDNKNQEDLKKIETLYRKNIFWASIKKIFWKETTRKIKVVTWVEENFSEDEKNLNSSDKNFSGNNKNLKKSESNLKWILRDKVEYKDIATKIIPLTNIRINNSATSIEDATEIIELETFDYESAKQQFSHFPNFKYVKKWKWEENSFDFLEKDLSKENIKSIDNNDISEECIVYYYWNKPKDEYAIVMNWVLLTQYGNPIPYNHKELPYSRAICRFIPWSFWSKSDVQLMKAAKKQKNIIRNALQDTVLINSSPIIKTVTSAWFNVEDFDVSPWAIWEFQDEKSANATQNMNVHWDINSALAYDAKLDEDITTLTGVDSRSLLNTMTETATKTAVKKESALKRINAWLKLIEHEALYRETKLKLELIKQYYKEKEYFIVEWEENKPEPKVFWKYKTIPIKDKKFNWKESEWDSDKMDLEMDESEEVNWIVSDLELKPELFNIDFEIEIRPASSIPFSESLEREKMAEIYQIVSNNPFGNPETALREFLKSRNIDPDNNWMKSKEELQMQNAQMMQ